MAGVRQRIEQQPAWVLHAQPWRETSLIVELFSRDHGRVAVVAKGARRPASQLRGLLMAFQPLRVDWSGGGEVKTLARAEWQGGQRLLGGRALLCGFYLNELVLRLTAREDPHPGVYDSYCTAVGALGSGAAASPVLRRFELALLRDLGYEASLYPPEGSAPIAAGDCYRYLVEHGLQRIDAAPGAVEEASAESAHEDARVLLSGQTLIDIAADDFSRGETLTQSRQLLRVLIQHTLGGQTLQSRRIFRELQEL